MTRELQDKVAIITGGGRGIGRAIATEFAAQGAAVVVTARTTSQLEETVVAIEGAGGKASMVRADITDQDDVQRVVSETESKYGPVDILINNAAVEGPAGPMWEVDPLAWRQAIDIDIFGQFLVTRAVLPSMIERRQGRIINMSSGASVSKGGFAGLSAYAASKAALNRMTETLAYEVKEYGINVFAMHPGVVRTEMLSAVFQPVLEKLAPGRAQQLWDTNTPMDAPVSLCLLLASGAADELSGVILHVDDDAEALVNRASEIDELDLYRMRIRKLDGR